MVHYDHRLWSIPHRLPCNCRIIRSLVTDPGKQVFQEIIYDYMTISHEFSNVSSCSKRYRLWQSSVPCVISLMLAIHQTNPAKGFSEPGLLSRWFSLSPGGLKQSTNHSQMSQNPKHHILGNEYQMPATLILAYFHLVLGFWPVHQHHIPGHHAHSSWGLSRLWVRQYHVTGQMWRCWKVMCRT